MIEVLNLALPYFGLVFLGYGCGRYVRIPEDGLAWMHFFIVYVALPCLFYRIVAQTPLEQLANPRYVLATTLATFTAFAVSFALAMAMLRGDIAAATIAGLAGGYGNTGYMGPGLALATLGTAAAAPVALIFCFESILWFSMVPLLMAIAGSEHESFGAMALEVTRKVLLHPFIIATALGVASAALHFEPPVALDRLMQFLQNASAPCALFALGLTVALRPIQTIPWEVPPVLIVKLVALPAMAMVSLSLLGPFETSWVHTAVLMAALPPALNVFVLARQYDVWVAPATGAVLLGTLVSVVSLTAVMWLVKTGYVPQTLLP